MGRVRRRYPTYMSTSYQCRCELHDYIAGGYSGARVLYDPAIIREVIEL